MFKKILQVLAIPFLILASPSLASSLPPLVIKNGQIQVIPSTDTLSTPAATTSNAGINLPPGTAPTSPNNGDCWTTSAGLYCQINGSTVGPYGTAGSGSPCNSVSGALQYYNGSGFGCINNTTASQTALNGLLGKNMYYASNYGVKADGKVLIDVTTTASSATVSSGSYTFVSGDVGKGVYISADTSTVLTNSTTVSGSTTITVSSTAGLTGSSGITAEVIDSQGNIPVNTQIIAILNSTQIMVSGIGATGASTTDTITIVPFVTNLTISSVSGGNAVLSGTVATALSGNAKMIFATIDTGNSSTGWTGVITAAAADPTGGVIMMPLGISMSGPLTIPANAVGSSGVSMYGLGAGKSVLRWFSTSNETVPLIGGNVGGGCTPALLGRWNNNRFSNFEIDMSGATNFATNVGLKAITVNCTTNITMDYLTVENALATCVATDYPHNGLKMFNRVQTCGRGNPSSGHNGFGDGFRNDDPSESEIFIANHCTNCGRVDYLAENEISNTTDTNASVVYLANICEHYNNYPLAGACIDDGTVGGAAVGNQVKGPFDTANGETIQYDGIRSSSATIGDAGGAGTGIGTNSIQGVRNCITLDENGISASIPSYANVNNNICKRGSGVGLLVNADNTNIFNGLDANHNEISDFGNSCIHFTTGGAHFQNVSIEGGILANCGKTGATALTQAAISIEAPIDGLTITGVRAFDNETGTQLYAIANKLANTNTIVYITKNNFVGNATAMFSPPSAGTFDGEIYDNLGSAPPAVTGSNCTATSITGNADIGSFVLSGTGIFVCSIKPYANLVNADHGYVAVANDLTTPTATVTQSISAQTTVTVTGTGVSGDTVNFWIKPW